MRECCYIQKYVNLFKTHPQTFCFFCVSECSLQCMSSSCSPVEISMLYFSMLYLFILLFCIIGDVSSHLLFLWIGALFPLCYFILQVNCFILHVFCDVYSNLHVCAYVTSYHNQPDSRMKSGKWWRFQMQVLFQLSFSLYFYFKNLI